MEQEPVSQEEEIVEEIKPQEKEKGRSEITDEEMDELYKKDNERYWDN